MGAWRKEERGLGDVESGQQAGLETWWDRQALLRASGGWRCHRGRAAEVSRVEPALFCVLSFPAAQWTFILCYVWQP